MYIHAKVIAGSRKEEFTQIDDSHFEILVKEKAERNEANKRVIELIRNSFGEGVRDVKIVNGHHSPSKLISVNMVGE